MRSEDLIALMIPVTFLVFIVIEWARGPGREWPEIPCGEPGAPCFS